MIEENVSYQSFVDKHQLSLVYHTMAWRQIVQNTYGYTPHYITAKDSAQTVGLLPLFEVNSLISGRHLSAIPFSQFVSVLYETEDVLEGLVTQAKELACQVQCRYIEVRGSAAPLTKFGFQVATHYWISTLSLQVDQKTLWRNLHHSTRRNIKKARKNDLYVRRARTTANFEKFYHLMLETRRRQGSPPYPAQLFTMLQKMPQARLYLVSDERQDLAGIIIFCYGDQVIYAYGASVSDLGLLRLRPNDLLFWTVITEMREEGYKIFNFGTTPINHKSLLRFKENWGSQSQPLAYAYWLNTITQIPLLERESRKVKLVSAFIRWMPLWSLRFVGRFLFKHLG